MSDQKTKEVLIVTNEAFPYGMAASNRILSHCKGFNALGVKSQVVIINKTETRGQERNRLSSGTFEGVSFKYLHKNIIRNRFKIKRGFDYYFKSLKLFFFLLYHTKKTTVVFYYCPQTMPAIFVWFASKIKSFILIKEETEYPALRVLNANRLKKHVFFRIHYTLFDGVTVITHQLMEYFKKTLGFSKPLCHIPMVVDVDRFSSNNTSNSHTSRTIVFVGTVDDQKEGVHALIGAFSKLINSNHNLELNIYGKPKDGRDIEPFLQQLRIERIEKKVFFHGYKNRDEITHILSNADILVFSRPHSPQAKYGFPTKLGEYLATGNPVVVTDVGEISLYLKDKHNAFICKPTVDHLASKLLEVVSDPILAKKVGKQGRLTAFKFFNNKLESQNILNFVDRIRDLKYNSFNK